jgi:cbb3-type cytochrome oxidase subunit 3
MFQMKLIQVRFKFFFLTLFLSIFIISVTAYIYSAKGEGLLAEEIYCHEILSDIDFKDATDFMVFGEVRRLSEVEKLAVKEWFQKHKDQLKSFTYAQAISFCSSKKTLPGAFQNEKKPVYIRNKEEKLDLIKSIRKNNSHSPPSIISVEKKYPGIIREIIEQGKLFSLEYFDYIRLVSAFEIIPNSEDELHLILSNKENEWYARQTAIKKLRAPNKT